MASQRSYARSKSRISQGRLQELMKEYIGEPTDDCMKEEPGKVKSEPVVQAELCQVKQELAPIKAEQSGSLVLDLTSKDPAALPCSIFSLTVSQQESQGGSTCMDICIQMCG